MFQAFHLNSPLSHSLEEQSIRKSTYWVTVLTLAPRPSMTLISGFSPRDPDMQKVAVELVNWLNVKPNKYACPYF